MNLKLTKTNNPKTVPDEGALQFGETFTDYMLLVDWTEEGGWQNARITPFENLSLHPAAGVLHCGAGVFEELKAYRRADGGVRFFRPMEHIRKMLREADSLKLPQIYDRDLLQMIASFVRVEERWIPKAVGAALYLRLMLISTDGRLGNYPARSATFAVFASPVGNAYTEGLAPATVKVNIGAGVMDNEGKTLVLDSVYRKYIEQVGATSVIFKINGRIVIPALTGASLPSVTRKSCIEILRYLGYAVAERRVSIDEIITAIKENTLEEAWGCSAETIFPIGMLTIGEEEYPINGGNTGEVAEELYELLTGIQWGTKEDTFNWSYKVC